MRISDWSSDVCSSDLGERFQHRRVRGLADGLGQRLVQTQRAVGPEQEEVVDELAAVEGQVGVFDAMAKAGQQLYGRGVRSEERRVGKECVSTCRSRW